MTIFNLYQRGESLLIIPVNERTREAIPAVEALLLNADTGGFRLAIEQGAWREDIYKSANNVYKVAGLSFDVLRQCAEIVLAAGETDVYVQLPDGESGWFNADRDGSGVSSWDGIDYDAEREQHIREMTDYVDDAPMDNFNYQRDPPSVLFESGYHNTPVRKEPRLNSTQNPGYPETAAQQSKDGAFTRAIHMLAWAAKALVHERTTKMVLGALPHTHKEIEDAIAEVERLYGKPEPSTDEGVRAYNWKR